ncbi:hypothetical protein ACFLY8_06145 [Halobacteriota archaeon]
MEEKVGVWGGGRIVAVLLVVIVLILGSVFGGVASASSEFIVDDVNSGFARYGPSSYWHEASIGYNVHMYWTYNAKSTVENYAKWTPSLSSEGAGNYAVYVYIPSNYASTTNAVYTIFHNGVTDTKYVNQAIYYSQWVSLGTFYFSATGNEYVKLVDATGEDSATQTIGFDAVKWVKQSLLPAPTLSNPSNGDTDVSLTPTFSWSPVSGANYYWLTVATDPSYLPTDPYETSAPGCVIGSDGVGISGTSYPTSTPLEPGTTYYWQVQAYHGSNAYNPDQQGEYSEHYSFTTEESLLPAPNLYSPADDAQDVSTTPYFDWSDISSANRYWLMVAENEGDLPTDPNAIDCPNCVISEDDITSSQYSTPQSTYQRLVKIYKKC